MRLQSTLLSALALIPALTSAWSPEDHEIFRLNDELTAAEGPNTTFYSFLNLKPSATHEEIIKGARTRSKQLHPDKAIRAIIAARSAPKPLTAEQKAAKKPVVTRDLSKKEKAKIADEATKRYQRLTVISNLLRGSGRVRYDHFLRNGFPRWRGTGYYYARFRPGLGTVLGGLLLVFGGGMHYGALYIGWKRHREFVQRYIAHARRMAWGNDSGIPGLDDIARETSASAAAASAPPEFEGDQGMALNRRQKRMQEKDSKKKDSGKGAKSARANGISRPTDGEAIGQGAQGVRKKVVAPNGKVLIVDAEGNVFLEEQTAEGEKHELLLDVSCSLDALTSSISANHTQLDEIPRPSIFQTAIFRVPIWAYSRTVGRFISGSVGSDEPLLDNGDLMIDPSEHGDELVDSATAGNANAEARKRKAKGKNGRGR